MTEEIEGEDQGAGTVRSNLSGKLQYRVKGCSYDCDGGNNNGNYSNE